MLTMIYYEIIHNPNGFYSKSPCHPMTSMAKSPVFMSDVTGFHDPHPIDPHIRHSRWLGDLSKKKRKGNR